MAGGVLHLGLALVLHSGRGTTVQCLCAHRATSCQVTTVPTLIHREDRCGRSNTYPATISAGATLQMVSTARRYSPIHPYEWIADPRHPWSAYNDTAPGRTGPFLWEKDRQVALAEYHNVTEGRYVCANGGNCTFPEVCECATGWSGFDCRTPICSQVPWTVRVVRRRGRTHVHGSGWLLLFHQGSDGVRE